MTERLETYNAQIIRDAIPDFNYWIKKRFWSIYECATLSLNKEPRILTAEKMSLCWATDAEFVSKHEDLVSTINREFDWQEDLSKYEGKVNVLGKNNTTGKLHLGIAPEIYIKWVEKHSIINLPTKLKEEYSNFVLNVRIQPLIATMSLADVCCKNDFALMLSLYNNKFGDEQVFGDMIYAAVVASTITPISSSYVANSEPSERNYVFHAKDLIALALSKKLTLPEELISLAKNKSNTIKNILPADKYIRWHEEANKIKQKEPSKSIPKIAKEIIELLQNTAPEYVRKDDGEWHPVGTIERILRDLFKQTNKKHGNNYQKNSLATKNGE